MKTNKLDLSRADIIVAAAALVFIFIVTLMQPSHSRALFPQPLRPGDKIAILSPAGPIDSALIDSAVTTLRAWGFNPVVYPHARGRLGHFSGSHPERLADLRAAFSDPDVRAILCSRGGYGVVHSLDSLIDMPLEKDPKWVIGFSDITALHALMASKGIASVHASMAKQLARGPQDVLNDSLLKILSGQMPRYQWPADPRNHPGRARGRLVGGNLAVLADLIATPVDMLSPGTILFIEDVSEPIYKIERIIYQMRLMGVFDRINGLIVGQFTDYKPDGNHEDMYDMLSEALAPWPSLPVAFGAPVGHVDYNVPLVEGAEAVLDVTPRGVTLSLAQ